MPALSAYGYAITKEPSAVKVISVVNQRLSGYTKIMERNINGNTTGIRAATLTAMESLYDMTAEKDEFVSYELLCAMAEYTGLLSREISVYIARDGRIVDVSVGDSSKVATTPMRLVRNQDRLSGIRQIHTHPSGDPRPSAVDLGTLRAVRLDAMCSLGVIDSKPSRLYAAFLGEQDNETGLRQALLMGPLRPDKLPHAQLMNEIKLADDRLRESAVQTEDAESERAVLVGMVDDSNDFASLDELEGLASAAGADIAGRFFQRRRPIDTATYLGSGKLEELALYVTERGCDLIIFDDELSAVQLRNIETATNTRVIDRTQLILDIFARRATSREGKLQVELAQLKYRLPRLLGMGTSMSRLGGGIGTRGPGEKKLEIDRRRIRRRIYELEQSFAQIEGQRELRRTKRDKSKTPLVALVGYTNAGKSTLTNALSGSSEFVSDMLFATLDTVVRKLTLPQGTEVLISDTVGFIDKLPHELVQAFRSTLDEVKYADVILNVVDASASDCHRHIEVVSDVLASLGAADIPRILVLNKSDKRTMDEDVSLDAMLRERRSSKDCVALSALTGEGMDRLLNTIERILTESMSTVELVIPYDKFEVVAYIRDNGAVLEENHEPDGTHIKARLDDMHLNRVKSMLNK